VDWVVSECSLVSTNSFRLSNSRPGLPSGSCLYTIPKGSAALVNLRNLSSLAKIV
jgi:hypothetical protein